MDIKTVTVLGANGTMGQNVAGIDPALKASLSAV